MGEWKNIPGRLGWQVNDQGEERHLWAWVAIIPHHEGYTDDEWKEYCRQEVIKNHPGMENCEIRWWHERHLYRESDKSA